MLKFFRKHQRIVFSLVAVVVIASFFLFGVNGILSSGVVSKPGNIESVTQQDEVSQITSILNHDSEVKDLVEQVYGEHTIEAIRGDDVSEESEKESMARWILYTSNLTQQDGKNLSNDEVYNAIRNGISATVAREFGIHPSGRDIDMILRSKLNMLRLDMDGFIHCYKTIMLSIEFMKSIEGKAKTSALAQYDGEQLYNSVVEVYSLPIDLDVHDAGGLSRLVAYAKMLVSMYQPPEEIQSILSILDPKIEEDGLANKLFAYKIPVDVKIISTEDLGLRMSVKELYAWQVNHFDQLAEKFPILQAKSLGLSNEEKFIAIEQLPYQTRKSLDNFSISSIADSDMDLVSNTYLIGVTPNRTTLLIPEEGLLYADPSAFGKCDLSKVANAINFESILSAIELGKIVIKVDGYYVEISPLVEVPRLSLLTLQEAVNLGVMDGLCEKICVCEDTLVDFISQGKFDNYLAYSLDSIINNGAIPSIPWPYSCWELKRELVTVPPDSAIATILAHADSAEWFGPIDGKIFRLVERIEMDEDQYPSRLKELKTQLISAELATSIYAFKHSDNVESP